jgi:acyl-CoA synthetase (AMP-forming)/AMP-acid ligase II
MAVTKLPDEIPTRTVNDLLYARADQTPDQVALIGSSGYGGESKLTYGELLVLAQRLAGALRVKGGVGPGDRVGVLTTNKSIVETVIAYHATHLLGGIVVPLNTRYVRRELSWVVRKIQPRVLLVGNDTAELLASCREHLEGDWPVVLEASGKPQLGLDLRRLIQGAAPVECVEVDEDADADWIFTSGTTGHPKAVAISHAASVACGYQCARLMGLHEKSVYSSSAPYFTSTGIHTNQLSVLAAGGTYLCEDEFNVKATTANIARHQVTSIFLISGMLKLILDRLGEAALAQVDLSSLERICYGGQAMPGSFALTVDRIFRQERGIDLVHLYGLTEGGTSGTFVPPQRHADAASRAARSPYGMPIGSEGFNQWVEFRVCVESGQTASDGMPGEICLRAPSLMDRYVDEPRATATALQDGWLHTGDLGIVEEGYLYYVDRAKQVIRRGGLNLSSTEIESVILECPGVREVAVVAVPNPILGEEVGAVIVSEYEDPDSAAIVDYCRAQLADFKVPVRVEFTDALPRNGMGRVQKHLLKFAH